MSTIFAAIGVTSAAQAAKLISMSMLTNFWGKILQEILGENITEKAFAMGQWLLLVLCIGI